MLSCRAIADELRHGTELLHHPQLVQDGRIATIDDPALGIDEWNIYGISYGSDLALQTLRDHPTGREYRGALSGDRAPLLVDSNGQDLNLPQLNPTGQSDVRVDNQAPPTAEHALHRIMALQSDCAPASDRTGRSVRTRH